jgi:hypothetical protein
LTQIRPRIGSRASRIQMLSLGKLNLSDDDA